jgi:UDP-N-acetylglucosamine--N-acetylmuramyl-(pentapeptide) pyrophosphoryl-undecaprenol N-acetylglucosamine transferase
MFKAYMLKCLNDEHPMKILLVGGGSGGPVVPLLALADEIKKRHSDFEFLLVGTTTGPERLMADNAAINFFSITSGKWRRYFAWENFVAPFLVLTGFIQSWKILADFKPNYVVGSGSFVQVPMIWAAKFKRIPVLIHQQDVIPNLANKICELAADKITITFPETLKNFSETFGFFHQKNNQEKIRLTGNPFREQLRKGTKDSARKFFDLSPDYPTLLVLGGGTGAEFLNDLIAGSLTELCKVVQIIHSTGAGKLKGKIRTQNYRPYEFIDNMADAYAIADIVLSRAGLSTITELSNLKKLGIIIPLPDSPQLANALMLVRAGAAIVFEQSEINPQGLLVLVRRLLFAHNLQQEVQDNISNIMPKESTAKIAEIILSSAEKIGPTNIKL